MKLILIFANIIKKVQADKNGCKYILFRIDIYFSECFSAVEINEKGDTDRDIILEEKRQKTLDASNAKNSYDLDYEVGNVQAFIDEFKNKKIKELEDKIKDSEATLKELEDKNKNLTTNQVTNNFKKMIIKNWSCKT